MENYFGADLLVADKRRHIRYFLYRPIQYGLISDCESVLLSGHMLNLGRSGLCIFTGYPLSQGQEIAIKDNALPLASGKATVRWISEIDGGNPFGYTYVAGLELAEYIPDIITLHD